MGNRAVHTPVDDCCRLQPGALCSHVAIPLPAVRAEGRCRAADPAGPGRQEHPPGPQAAGAFDLSPLIPEMQASGPTALVAAMQAFATPEMIDYLVKEFDLKPAATGDFKGDLKAMMAGH